MKAILALAIVIASAPLPAQMTSADVRPGSRVRVWYSPYRMEAERAVVRARRGDSLVVQVLRLRDATGHLDNEAELRISSLDSLEIGTHRRAGSAVVGAVVGAAIGLGAASVIVASTGKTARDSNRSWPPLLRISTGVLGGIVGGIRGANKSERWVAVPLR